MKGGFKNALPWIVLLTIVIFSVGVGMVVVEGLAMEKEKKKEDPLKDEKDKMARLINLVR